MPRSYVDNAMNRSLGRVGMAVGSMPVSSGSSYSSGSGGYGSSSRTDSSRSSYHSDTYVDNSMNRSLGRVGMAVGSMPVSKGSSYSSGSGDYSKSSRTDSSRSSYHSDTYVDNSMNRSLGRVGMAVGTMPVSKGSNYSTGRDEKGSSSRKDSGFSRSSDSSDKYLERSRCSSASGGGDRNDILNDSVFLESSHYPDTYVDNSMNRKLGRVGKPLGSMPVSRGSSYGSGKGDERVSRKDSGFSSCSSDTYNDNDYNRKFGREDLLRKSTASTYDLKTSENPSPVKTYVDNAYNRKYDRVGLPVGSKIISKHSENTALSPDASQLSDSATKVYKDNPMNRELGRVGKPLGSAVYSPKAKVIAEKFYMDTEMNRTIGRVGKPLGSMPIGKRSYTTQKTREVIEKMKRKEVEDLVYDKQYTESDVYQQQGDVLQEAMRHALDHFNRFFEEMTWKTMTSTTKPPKTKPQVIQDYRGRKIPYTELKLAAKIGSGGFGEVYFAKWKETIVAVKKLQAEAISKRRLEDFAREMMLYCDLDHENIVTFIGACVERPNLCIIMEYMQMSLFEAIHIREDVDFSEAERLVIIRNTCRGLKYLHSLDIAHRDLKTANVLVNYQDEVIEVKITDFGLSSMKSNKQTSSAYRGEVIGTPRYSAPEVLRGERALSVEDYKKADIYSLALVIFEVVFEEEPFYDFDIHQLIKYVGRFGVSPDIPEGIKPTRSVMKTMEYSWCCKPDSRPDIKYVYDVFQAQKKLYTV